MSQFTFKIEGTKDGSINDVMLYRSTITDTVAITVNGQEICMNRDEFERLAHLMIHDFYTRDILEDVNREMKDGKNPDKILISRDLDCEKWEEV